MLRGRQALSSPSSSPQDLYYCPHVPNGVSQEQSQRPPSSPHSATPAEGHSLERDSPRGASLSRAVPTSRDKMVCETQIDSEIDGQLAEGRRSGFKSQGRRGPGVSSSVGWGPGSCPRGSLGELSSLWPCTELLGFSRLHQASVMLSASDPRLPSGIPSCPILSPGGQGDGALSRRPSCAPGHLSSMVCG